MKYLLLSLALGAVLTGCNQVDGQLNVTEAFTLKSAQGTTTKIEPGTYTANLSTSIFGKKIKLQLNKSNDEIYNFKIPDGTKLPENGDFTLKSSDIGQAVELKGTVETKTSDSASKEDYTSCTYTEPYTVCSSGPNGQPICSVAYRTVFGSQWERYHDHFVDQHLTMDLTAVNAKDKAAEFTGELNTVQRIVENQSGCH